MGRTSKNREENLLCKDAAKSHPNRSKLNIRLDSFLNGKLYSIAIISVPSRRKEIYIFGKGLWRGSLYTEVAYLIKIIKKIFFKADE